MTEMKTILFVIIVFSLLSSMSIGFYSDMMSGTDQTPTDISILNKESNITSIQKESENIIENIPQPQDINIFTIPSLFLSVGFSVISLVLQTPALIWTLMTDIATVVRPLPIPTEFMAMIYLIVSISIIFGIAKFLAGRT